MSSIRAKQRAKLVQAVGTAGRDLSAHTVMFHSAVAHKLGLGPTDHKAFDFILRHGPVTAGQLAEITGVTTGAVTGMIDRLEKAGYVERLRGADDRRQVLVRSSLTAARERRCCELFDSLGEGVCKVARSYSERELSVILDFLERSAALLHAETRKLRGEKQ